MVQPAKELKLYLDIWENPSILLHGMKSFSRKNETKSKNLYLAHKHFIAASNSQIFLSKSNQSYSHYCVFISINHEWIHESLWFCSGQKLSSFLRSIALSKNKVKPLFANVVKAICCFELTDGLHSNATDNVLPQRPKPWQQVISCIWRQPMVCQIWFVKIRLSSWLLFWMLLYLCKILLFIILDLMLRSQDANQCCSIMPFFHQVLVSGNFLW